MDSYLEKYYAALAELQAEAEEEVKRARRKALERKIALIAFECIFFANIIWLAPKVAMLPWWVLLLSFLATMRMAHTISYNEVMAWFREPFCDVTHDSCGAGSNVEPKGDGLINAVGNLIACSVCSGTWAALILVDSYFLLPKIGTALILVLGIAGGSELLHYSKELLEWGGRAARVYSGKVSPDEE